MSHEPRGSRRESANLTSYGVLKQALFCGFVGGSIFRRSESRENEDGNVLVANWTDPPEERKDNNKKTRRRRRSRQR
jgi:hypothetical protein